MISRYGFLEKLKSASSVSLRIKNGSRTEDFKFSLKGSTKAINYVIPPNEFQRELSVEKEVIARVALNMAKEDSIRIAKKKLISSLVPISLLDSTEVVQTIPRDKFIGERVKFLIDFDNKYGYQGFSKTDDYGSLNYEEFKGRIARFISFKIKYPNQSIERRIYKLVMEEKRDTIQFELSNYSEIRGYVGFISILEEARKKYVGKKFYFGGSRNFDIKESNGIQECLIKRIEFAEEDLKYAQLYGAFNVYYDVNGEERVINVNFSETYAREEKKYDSYKNKIFENIFYQIKERN